MLANLVKNRQFDIRQNQSAGESSSGGSEDSTDYTNGLRKVMSFL